VGFPKGLFDDCLTGATLSEKMKDEAERVCPAMFKP